MDEKRNGHAFTNGTVNGHVPNGDTKETASDSKPSCLQIISHKIISLLETAFYRYMYTLFKILKYIVFIIREEVFFCLVTFDLKSVMSAGIHTCMFLLCTCTYKQYIVHVFKSLYRFFLHTIISHLYNVYTCNNVSYIFSELKIFSQGELITDFILIWLS